MRNLFATLAVRWQGAFSRLLHDEQGASLEEYVLLVMLIAVVCFVAVQALGQQVAGRLERSAGVFPP